MRPFLPAAFAAISFACGAAPSIEGAVTATSQSGLVQAHVQFEGAVRRGDNALQVDFVALAPAAATVKLVAIEALMAAHGHRANADRISIDAPPFRASGLNLFMTGRWQVELALRVDEAEDFVTFPVDVP
jgi:hypothetical protein